MIEEAPRYKQLSEPPKPPHQHAYEVVAAETIIIRFCPDCGMSWKLAYQQREGYWPYTWVPLEEPKE